MRTQEQWDDYIKDRVRASSGWYFLNADVQSQVSRFGEQGGLYIYTNRLDWMVDHAFKNGLTIRGEQRVYEQGKDAFVSGDGYIVGFIPMQITDNQYDKRIHKILVSEFDCVIKTKDSTGIDTEWVCFPEDVTDPSINILDAVRIDKSDDSVGRREFQLLYTQALEVEASLKARAQGCTTQLHELAARFGKTTKYLTEFLHTDSKVMVVASYNTSALSSYQKEIRVWDAFTDFVECTTKTEVNKAVKSGKRALVLVSLCGEEANWYKKWTWVSDLKHREVYVDEADEGAHTENQFPKVEFLRQNSNLYLFSGTGADRAASDHDIDNYRSVTYWDMLSDKQELREGLDVNEVEFEYLDTDIFPIRTDMDILPDAEIYRMDWSALLPEADELNISWTKFAEKPEKSMSWFSAFVNEVFGTQSSTGMLPSVHELVPDLGDIQVFLPMKAGIKKTDVICKHLKTLLPESQYVVIPLTGKYATGHKAEEYVKNLLENQCFNDVGDRIKHAVIVTPGHIGSKSFSIPTVNLVELWYDGGGIAATAQRSSRSFTIDWGRKDKVGRVISRSVDRTREDNPLDGIVLLTAVKHNEKHPGVSITDSMRHVLRSMNVLTTNEHGDPVSVDIDSYSSEILNSRNLSNVIANSVDPNNILNDLYLLDSFNEYSGDKFKAELDDIGIKGDTFVEPKTVNSKDRKQLTEQEKADRDFVQKFRLWVKEIGDNVPFIVAMTGTQSIRDAIHVMSDDHDLQSDFYNEFDIPFETFQYIVDKKYIPVNLLEIAYHVYSNEKNAEHTRFWEQAA